jgi:(5-formylfuran-3-yl)methyl phosphate synthase
MIDWNFGNGRPGLLVSVRSAEEATTALLAGANVIDVKEPSRGSLGAADESVISSVLRVVEGRAPVTAALGELVDLSTEVRWNVPGVAMFKAGLAGCAKTHNWQAKWGEVVTKFQVSSDSGSPQAVAVVYADWQAADAPSPDDVLSAAVNFRCPALLIDTWNKSSGALFDHWQIDDLRAFISRVRARTIKVVLAGSLAGESFAQAVALRPDLVAVRSAACESGRTGQVVARRVRELKETIDRFTHDK